MRRGVVAAVAVLVVLGIASVVPAQTAIGDTDHGTVVVGSRGVSRSVAQLQAAATRHPGTPHAPLPVRRGPAKAAGGDTVTVQPAPTMSGPRVALGAQTFDGPSLEAANQVFPPDTQGDIGPTQFVVTLNSRFRSYTRSGVADGALDLPPEVFFASEMTPGAGNFASDPHIRYDRLSQRWFVVMIDVPGGAGTQSNRIMIAVSNGPTITSTTDFTFFHFQAPALQFADYPTLGIDAQALYIGTNDFSTLLGSYTQSDGYVVPKASLLGGAGPVTPTRFANLPMFTPQGVDDPYAADAAGYFVGVDANNFGMLTVVRVSAPGGTSTITSHSITVPATSTPLLVPHQGNTGGNNGRLDGLDDRLLEATMTADGHIWTAHGIGVNASGAATSPNRDGARWYELGTVSTTPALVQSGTVFDNAAANPSFYWMPTVAVSGQGIMAIGGSTAGTGSHAGAWFATRLPTDPQTTTSPPTQYTGSGFAYNPPGDTGGAGGRRWGDYSLTRVDPLDNQTIWTIQEYASAADTWGVKVARLQAPGPATPATASAVVGQGTANVPVTVTGTSTGGSGWYDPGAGFPQRLQVAVGCGVRVNSVSVVSPTRLDLGLDTRDASLGTCAVTTTNPDGQVTGAAVLQVVRFRPDGLIRLASAASYRGNNVYNTTGTDQTASARRKRRARQAFSLLVQNDGNAADSFRLAGPGGRPGFRVHYFLGTTDVTTSVLNGTFVTGNLAPGATSSLRLVVKVRRHAVIGSVRSWLVRVSSTRAPATVDAIRARVRVVRG